MARILFLSDFEQGHLFPTFGLASSLESRGHEVTYAGIADIEPYVARQGFGFRRIFEETYPEGSSTRLRHEAQQRAASGGADDAPARVFTDHLEPLIEGSVDALMEELRPDLVVSSLFLSLETLIFLYRYGAPMAVFTQCLREAEMTPAQLVVEEILDLDHISFRILELAMSTGCQVRSLDQLTRPLAEIPELLACPHELDLPGVERLGRVHYVEPCIRRAGSGEGVFDWHEIPDGKQLVVVSLGSQTEIYQETARGLYTKLFDLARATRDEPWHFVVSLGPEFEAAQFGDLPENVTVSRWLPQLELLPRAALMITHGGLGTVKECIYHGVPMVVTPMSRDQPENAERVAHHRLGVALDPATASVDALAAAVRRAATAPEIQQATEAMSRVFRAYQEGQPGARVLEELLSGETPRVAPRAAAPGLPQGFAG